MMITTKATSIVENGILQPWLFRIIPCILSILPFNRSPGRSDLPFGGDGEKVLQEHQFAEY
jgi:hypothetical protein